MLITTRGNGQIMTSAIIYPYKRAVPKNMVDKVPTGYCIARSDSGWMTSDIFYEYLANVFIPELNNIRKERKCLQSNEELLIGEKNWVVF